MPGSKIKYFLASLLQLSFTSKGQLTTGSFTLNEHRFVCNKDFDCCKETSTRLACALCIGGVCDQVLKDQYKIGLPCTLERKHCAKDYCNPRVRETWAGFGECICYCDDLPFHGKKCDIPYEFDRFNEKHNYPSGIQFITPAFVMFAVFKKGPHIVVTIDSGFEPVPALIIEDTAGGFLVRVEKPDYHQGNRWNLDKCMDFVKNEDGFLYLEMCHIFMNFKRNYLVFIIPFLIPLDLQSQPGTDIRSWIVRQLKMDVVQPRLLKQPLVSTHSRDYIVGSLPFQELEKYPILKMTNCGKTLETAQGYLFNEEILLKVNLFFYNSETRSLEPPHEYFGFTFSRWDFYKFKGDTRQWVYQIVLQDDIPRLCRVPKFKLTPDTYVINLTVTIKVNHIKKFFNFNTCVINVAWAPLLAILSGGSYRSVYRDHSLVLDGSESSNPNHVDDWQVKRLQMTLWCNWTMEAVCKPRYLTSSNRYRYKIKPNILKSKRAYNFTLKVSDKVVDNTAYATQIIYVNEREEDSIGAFTIDCVYNCKRKSNPKDIIYLRVGGNWTYLKGLEFHWFLLNSEGKETEIDQIRQGGTASFILIINEGAFRDKETHKIEVRYKSTVQLAVYSITTSFTSSYTCSIKPEKGQLGFTRFAIACQLTILNRVLEFYDKHENDEPNFSGRMFAFQKTGDVQELILTRGKVEIHSFDEYGLDTVFTLSVKLSKRNTTMAYIYKLLHDLSERSNDQEVGETFKTASVVCDLLPTTEEDMSFSKSYLYESLLLLLSKLSIDGYGYAKLGISTLHNTLLAARASMTLEGALFASRTLRMLAFALVRGLKENPQCTFSTLYQIISLCLDCIFVVLETEEKLIGTKDFQINNIVPVYPRVKEITQNLLRSSYHLQSALSYKQLPGQQGKLVESKLGNITIWTKVDIPDSISRYTQEEYRKGTLPVIVPDALAKDATQMGLYLAIQYMSFKRDPTFRLKINTRDALDVSVCFKENYGQACKYPKRLKNGVQVAFNISDLISHKFTNLSLERLDGLLEPDWLDEELPVYKLDALPPVDMLAIFRFNITDSYPWHSSVYVTVKRDIRPTYDSLLSEKHELTPENPIYQVVYNPTDTLHLYYLAIQPSNRIDINETLNFGMKIFSKTCYSWHKYWETRGCQSVAYLNGNTVICECKTLSLIGGLIQEVVPKLDVVENLPLFLTINGIFVEKVMSLLLVLLLFALVAFLCVRADRADRSRRFVSILPDNLPGDRYGYLVCVVTGARFGAGTDAAVGIRLYGTINDSRSHVLTNENHHVMKSMGEDWFLIFEPETLGKIIYTYLWHDNAGAKPAWFCDSVTIYDLHHEDCYFFYVNDWITLSLKCFPEVTILPTPLSTILSPPKTFVDNFRLSFYLSHLWLDIVIRHPRDPVTRIDRLAIGLCFLFVSISASIIILKLSDSYIEVDDFSYSVTITMIEVAIFTCFLATTVACILMQIFRQIYKIIFYEGEKTINKGILTHILQASEIDYLSQSSLVSLKDDKTYIHYGQRHKPSEKEPTIKVVDRINLRLMPKPLVPVQLDGDEPNVIVQKFWLFTAWTTVAFIIIICTVVSLALSKGLPPVKTLKWLSIVGIEVLIHALILQPLKITLTSAILAASFKRVIYKDVYTFDPDDGRRKSHFGDIKVMARFVTLRSNLMYKPLHEVFREKHRIKMVKASQWRRLYELMVETLVLLFLSALLSAHIPTKYQTNSHHRRLDKFNSMINTTDLKTFQCNSETYFFRYAWYNWDILSRDSELNFFRKDWMYDNVNRLLGKIRLRQFRVLPGYCKAPVNLTIDCAAPFSRRSKDTRNYYPFWTIQDNNTHQDTDISVGIGLLKEWVYYWPSNETEYNFEGKTSQMYPSGGYMWDLKASSEAMDASLAMLWEEWWIDHYTRAVILEVTVYNVNTRLFSRIVLLSEQTIAGQIISVTLVNSVDINNDFDYLLVIFICFVFMLWNRILMLANYVGAWGFLKNWRRPYEVVLAVNGLAVVIYLLLHILTVSEYVENYQLHSDELRYFNFYRIAHSKFTARSLLCLLYILNLVKFYSLWRFGKTFYRYILTLKFSTKTIILSAIIFVFFQFMFCRIVSYILYIFIDTIFNPNMIYKFNYLHTSKSGFVGVNVFSFAISYCCVILMVLYLIIFVAHYKISKYEVTRHWGIYNYITLVKDDIMELLKTPMVTRVTVRVGRTIASLYEGRKSKIRLRNFSME